MQHINIEALLTKKYEEVLEAKGAAAAEPYFNVLLSLNNKLGSSDKSNENVTKALYKINYDLTLLKLLYPNDKLIQQQVSARQIIIMKALSYPIVLED